MMTIEEEISHIIAFLSHSCGFEVSLYAMLSIRPVSEDSPPSLWEVSWTDFEEETQLEYHRLFSDLEEAIIFFVEKRRYKCIGADFEKMRQENADH